ncbi:PREDICTED: BEACH domain-containing protein B-like [Camelina sativa]|uniref:BEACH domain-containing protein B-like n=1 Tax=Camelina sativa TaxID=90675 RepID=A0ABM0WP88_CAMSA|nr:PREDICTED: BEACH domain-containing protein B-like [Camelina sativa]
MESESVAASSPSSDATTSHFPSVSVLLDALEQSATTPRIANGLSQRLLRSLQLSNENRLSFKALNGACRVLRLACNQARESRKPVSLVESSDSGVVVDSPVKKSDSTSHTEDCWFECVESCVGIFTEFFSSADDAKVYVLRSSVCVDCLFELFWEKAVRNNVMKLIIDLMKIRPSCDEDKSAKSQVCSKYLETFTQVKERENDFVDLSVDLLAGMRDLIKINSRYYQALFREGECFLHIVSLLNGNLDEANGEKLVLNVLQTLTSLLANNDTSKFAFKALAGKGYQTLQSLLLDFFQWKPTQRLLDALLDMLVDGKFDDKGSALIKNEDVIILYLNVLQKSSESLQCYGLNLFQQLLRDSISNRASCVRAGMLHLLLDWFSLENDDSVILKITQLTQTNGGHSISGKDIRKIFALLRSERVGNQQRYRSLLLACLLSMLNEKGPTGFFDMNGVDSGIVIRTPVQWPANKGFSFCCWLRVESFPGDGKMGIFSFMSKNGKGCFAAIGKDGLSYVSLNLKRLCVNVHTNLVCKKWHFICVSHSIGRAFWGGSLLRCYVDGDLVSSERCSYPKVTDVLTSCLIGTRITLPQIQDNDGLESIRDVFPFFGQIGPVYLFNDSLSSEQVQAIYSLGPSYMYAFLENEMTGPFSDNPFPSGILDGKDGLASKVSFGLNAQASDGRRLFNVSRVSDHLQERLAFEADIMVGTQLCSRRLLQQIIYCVGGISVFFPLITQSDRCESEAFKEENSAMPTKERMIAEVIELIASVLDENPANQQQMHLLSGFPILGFLLQSIQPKQLNLETLSSLTHLFNVISSSGFAEQLVEDAISSIFLNPHIWLHAAYNVQRELYMFLIQQLDNDPRLLGSLCRLPRVIDIVWNFYWESEKYLKGSKTLMHPARTITERPSKDEIHKIRLLLLSLGEMSLRQNISSGDVKALTAFFETCQDVACIEDVLHMIIRAISQTSILVSFLEQVNLIGGCHIFVNLLQRDYEPIRLLGLQFLGRLLYDIPSEKKGPKFFNLAVGRTKSLSQGHKKIGSRTQPIFLAMSDRLFQYPQTDNLRATLFDVLLGGASPKQVLQKHNQVDKLKGKPSSSHFFLPQVFVFIFEFLSGCKDGLARMKIISDILDLLDSNPMNVEALMEFGWSAWLLASVKLDVIKDYRSELINHDDLALNEQHFVRGLFCVVLCHYILSVKGGWQQLEETVNFILLQSEHNDAPYRSFLRDLYEDLIQRLVELSSEDNIFLSHPCRDNVLYLLRLVDEMLVREFGSRLLFPAVSTEFSEDLLQLGNREDHSLGLDENFQRFLTEETSRNTESQQSCTTVTELMTNKRWWNLYDNLWRIICDINGRGPVKISPKSSATGPSIGMLLTHRIYTGSPEMFIARNREALESEYVSSHLHDWIDLIFGHKQRGKPAVEAANIFYYLTYEGAVDPENMEDELQISAIEDQIANFGQTPIQIFRKKHPRRGPPIPIAHPLYFAPASINLTSILPATTHPPSAVLYVGVVDSNIVLVNQGLTLSVKIWLTTQLHSGGNFTFSSAQDPFFGVGSDVLSPRNIGSPLADNVELGSQCFAAMHAPLENFLVSCGNWENSFHVISLSDGRVVQSIRHHKDVVSCVAVTADSSILATGSYDTTVMVWDVIRMRTPEKRVRNTQADVMRKDIVLADAPSHILCGHDDIITCLYVSTDLDIVISGSKDGTCVFHTLREGRYIRSLKHPSGSAVSKIAASHHGRIVLYGDDDLSLHLYSINGKHLASSESNGRINCLELSKCGEFLVSAGDQGQIVVRSMNTLEVVRRYNGAGKIITSLTVTQEECFLAGTKDGALLVYSIENPQHRKPSPIWSTKS